jgi:hypothetical protein
MSHVEFRGIITNWLGQELNVGDVIVYPWRSGSMHTMRIGIIKGIQYGMLHFNAKHDPVPYLVIDTPRERRFYDKDQRKQRTLVIYKETVLKNIPTTTKLEGWDRQKVTEHFEVERLPEGVPPRGPYRKRLL